MGLMGKVNLFDLDSATQANAVIVGIAKYNRQILQVLRGHSPFSAEYQ
jgi:hypothetical protein